MSIQDQRYPNASKSTFDLKWQQEQASMAEKETYIAMVVGFLLCTR